MMPCPSVVPAHSHPPVASEQSRAWQTPVAQSLPSSQPQPPCCGPIGVVLIHRSHVQAEPCAGSPVHTAGIQNGGGSSWLSRIMLLRMTFTPSRRPTERQKLTGDVQPWVWLSSTRLYWKVTAAVPSAKNAPPPWLRRKTEFCTVTFFIGPSAQLRWTAYWEGMCLVLVAVRRAS